MLKIDFAGYGLREYEVLHILPFDSNRKRMSIIVRDPETQEKVLYCKGKEDVFQIEKQCFYGSLWSGKFVTPISNFCNPFRREEVNTGILRYSHMYIHIQM